MPEVTKYDQGTPSWVDLATTDVEAAAKVEPAGGRVVMQLFDVMDNGRMAVITDPEGAYFALWQPKESIGAEIVNEHGALCWNEVAVDDPQKLIPFYEQVLNVKFGRVEGVDMEYWMLKVGGRDVGGMMPKNEQMKGLASHWSVYFAVDDCDGSVEKAKSMKAQVIVPPADMGPYRFAVLQDPQGAVFSVVKMEQPAE